MAHAWQLRFQPTIIALTPQKEGKFSVSRTQPGVPVVPAGSFQVVTAAMPRLSETNSGPSPLAPGTNAAASVEFIAGPQPARGTTQFVSLGVLPGRVDFNTSGKKPVPRFTGGTKRGSNNEQLLDFRPATTPVVANSDWVLHINHDPDTFVLDPAHKIELQLPWQFIENPGIMQLTARLTIGTTMAADETRNTPLEIPLRHLQVPDDANPTHNRLTFFGVRNLYSKSNASSLPRIVAGDRPLTIILHSTFTDFCTQKTSATVDQVTDLIFSILNDAGFITVVSLVGAAAAADCNLHWKQVGGHFMGRKIIETNPKVSTNDRLENRFAAAITTNTTNTVSIPFGMEEVVPFFRFYIMAEDVDPPGPAEFAHSEIDIPSLRDPVAPTKALSTPIVIAKGFGGGSPLRQQLAQIDRADHANLLATTICHEIGHSFGLRHAVAFTGQPPYVVADPQTTRGAMGAAVVSTGLGTPRSALGFFGPVHVQEIQRMFL